jgi:peptidoglycan/LPS O-acetylase OafA/YrhL
MSGFSLRQSSAAFLRRRPPSVETTIGSRANNFNAIRLILAVSVIFFHSFDLVANGQDDDPISAVLPTGDLGNLAVNSFFFLSGLFVTQSFFRDPSVVNFTIRRFCRIWPGYFVCLLVTASISVLVCQTSGSFSYLTYPDFYTYILQNSWFNLTWNMPGVFTAHNYTAINGSIHTLPTEIKMYLLLAIAGAAYLLRNRGVVLGLGCVILLVLLLRFNLLAAPLALPDYGQAAGAMFFGGVLVFAAAQYILPSLWLSLGSLTLAYFTSDPWSTIFLLAAAAGIILYAGQIPLPWRPKSDLSYGIYIYGWPCQQVVVNCDPAINPYWLFAGALCLATGFAWFSWRLIEKPAIDFGHRLAARWTRFRSSKPRDLQTITAGPLPGWPNMAVTAMLLAACLTMFWISNSLLQPPIRPLGVQITAYGPTQTAAGVGFNVQPSGQSAMWLAVSALPPDGTAILFDGRRLSTQLTSKTVSAIVPNDLFAKAGDKHVVLELRLPNCREQSNVVTVKVTKKQARLF